MNTPSSEQNLAFTPAVKLISMIRNKEVSSVELINLYLERIEKLDDHLHSYLTVDAENAISESKKAQAQGSTMRIIEPFVF